MKPKFRAENGFNDEIQEIIGLIMTIIYQWTMYLLSAFFIAFQGLALAVVFLSWKPVSGPLSATLPVAQHLKLMASILPTCFTRA